MIPLAHAGHVLVDLLYVAPVAVVVGWLGFTALRDRRRRASADSASGPEQP